LTTLFELRGQGWPQLEELVLAFVLSAFVGLERELRQKSAGLRTYTLVGVSAALFMLISKYGFTNVLVKDQVVLDPSRVAAQIVSGIGFIGGGVIFMRRDAVRGLTTAASVWLTAALGMACGAGLVLLAVATTIMHVVIMFGFPKIIRLLPRERPTATRIMVAYADGRGILRTILTMCTQAGFSIDQVDVERDGFASAVPTLDAVADGGPPETRGHDRVVLGMRVKGKRPIADLLTTLSEIDGIARVSTSVDDALE
jgi:putative Mg2+ transporter-C (MgtC) family protein